MIQLTTEVVSVYNPRGTKIGYGIGYRTQAP